MGFSVGDKIMHPKFGAGRITGEVHRELVDGFKHYYVIEVLGRGATAYVPVSKMDELGVRMVMSQGKLAQVMGTLRSVPSTLSNDYKQRQAGVNDILITRRPIQVAETVRDLTWHRKRKHLTEIPDVHEMIDGALKTAMASGFDKLENTQKGDVAAASTLGTQAQAAV
jgi:CarD family transcriptional regulator